jgi:type IV pilus assembly protein PilM
MGQKVLGVEVTEKSIKLAVVKNGGHPKLLACNIIATPKNAYGMGAITDVEGVALTIKEALLKDKATNKGIEGVALCINEPQTVVRTINLPPLPEKELAPAVEYELSQSFPGIVKTHAISFKEYTRSKEGIGGIVSFSPLKTLEVYTRLIDALDYKNSYIDVLSNAEAKAYSAFVSPGKTDRAVVLCDIGHVSTQFTILEGNLVRHSRQIPEGDRLLERIACDRLSITPEEYETLRLEAFRDKEIDESDILSIIHMVYFNIEEQLRQTVEFYNSGTGEQSSVSEVVLIGGGSIFPKLEEHFTTSLGLPVRIIKPLAGVKADHVAFIRCLANIGAAIRED